MSFAAQTSEENLSNNKTGISYWLGRVLPGMTLSWIAILASVLTLYSNLQSILHLSRWVEYVVVFWSDQILKFWNWAGGYAGASVELGEASVLTIAALLTVAALSVRYQKPELGIKLSEMVFRLFFYVVLFALAILANYFLGQQFNQSFTTGVSLTFIMVVGLTLFSRREGTGWVLSVVNSVIMIIILAIIYAFIFFRIRSAPDIMSFENWSIVVALLAPIVPICISRTSLLRNRLMFIIAGVLLLFIFNEITYLVV